MSQKLILLMWVSGSGKSTIIQELLSTYDRLEMVNSYTTRPMRSWEVNGDRYTFVSNSEFEYAVQNGEFLEYAFVHKQYYYGTKIADVQKIINNWKSPITEVDMHWLEKIQRIGDLQREYKSIFLDVPNELIKHRTQIRWQMSHDDLNKRLESAIYERNRAQCICDYIIDTSWEIKENIYRVNQVLDLILEN